MCAHTPQSVQKSKYNLQRSILSFYHVGLRDQIQVTGNNGKFLSLPSHLASLQLGLFLMYKVYVRCVQDNHAQCLLTCPWVQKSVYGNWCQEAEAQVSVPMGNITQWQIQSSPEGLEFKTLKIWWYKRQERKLSHEENEMNDKVSWVSAKLN